jgi:transposase InsO family protein
MAYSSNPNLPKARATAMRLLVTEQLALVVVARKCGVHRSTIWRWKKKWDEINKSVQLTNDNRPGREPGARFRQAALRWNIPTLNSAALTSPHALSQAIVQRVLELRHVLKRCAEIIWHHMVHVDAVHISLSSVHRILRRHHQYDGARKNRIRPDNPRRPHPTKPGELVQTDTIHYICPTTYKRRYVYTVIDLYSRMTYAEIHNRILPGKAADAVVRAQEYWGFGIAMIQADNGPEYSRYFEQRMTGLGIQVRHSRLGRPNDNAHIERFNRTIQEECLGSRISSRVATATLQKKITQYIAYYNYERIHLGLQLKVPVSMLQRS